MSDTQERRTWLGRIADVLTKKPGSPNAHASAGNIEENGESVVVHNSDVDMATLVRSIDRYDIWEMRSIEIEGETYRVPFGIRETEYGWTARWWMLGYETRFWRFERINLTRREKLEQAKTWLAMMHPREFVVCRTAIPKGSGRNMFAPQFRLMVKEYPGTYPQRWMSEKLGGLWFITQERIDEAIEVLNRRLDHYEVREKTLGHTVAAKFKASDVDPSFVLNAGMRPMSLKLHDLLAWTGNGQGFQYEPSTGLSPQRNKLYWPELEGFIVPRCPTIRAQI